MPPSLRVLLLKDLLEGGQPVKASTYETADSVAPLVCLLGMNQDIAELIPQIVLQMSKMCPWRSVGGVHCHP